MKRADYWMEYRMDLHGSVIGLLYWSKHEKSDGTVTSVPIFQISG
jgi:hypothetical protein